MLHARQREKSKWGTESIKISWAGLLRWQLVLSELVKATTEHNNTIWLLLQKLFSWGEFPLTKWRFENKSSLRGMEGGGMFFCGHLILTGTEAFGIWGYIWSCNLWTGGIVLYMSTYLHTDVPFVSQIPHLCYKPTCYFQDGCQERSLTRSALRLERASSSRWFTADGECKLLLLSQKIFFCSLK